VTAALDPSMARILERMRAAPAIDYASVPIVEARRAFDKGAAQWQEALPRMATRDLLIPVSHGTMRARLHLPGPGRRPLVIFVHGGGWTFGSVDTHGNEMRGLAVASGCAVLGFDYRLAPEHPFPAGLEDTLAAIAFAEAGALGEDIDATRFALAGDSAGANLALGALLARRDAGATPTRGAALFYGCFAPDFDTESHARLGDGAFMLSSDRMRWYWRNFLGAEHDDTCSLAAPGRAELSRLPRLYLAAAGLDPLLDDTLELSRRLAHAGVAHRCDVVPGVIHGFLRMAPELPAARNTLEAAGTFLASAIK
jgi:acetyl esterase